MLENHLASQPPLVILRVIDGLPRRKNYQLQPLAVPHSACPTAVTVCEALLMPVAIRHRKKGSPPAAMLLAQVTRPRVWFFCGLAHIAIVPATLHMARPQRFREMWPKRGFAGYKNVVVDVTTQLQRSSPPPSIPTRHNSRGVGRGISPRPQPQTGRASFPASGFPDCLDYFA